MTLVNKATYPKLAELIAAVLHAWPQHDRALTMSFTNRAPENLRHSERIATMIMKLSSAADGGLPSFINDYRFLCEEIVLPEEIHFRREGTYRLKTFAEALDTVYNNKPFMTKYMNGLLLSDVLWVNHCRALQNYAEAFLPTLKAGADLLEIGPGHGLLLNLASDMDQIGSISAWDVSQTSLNLSAHALNILGAKRQVNFNARNIFDQSIMAPEEGNQFDGIVLSEVLEHLEQPRQALDVLFHLCRPGGSIWINVPANSPAPDHLFLIGSPEEVMNLVEESGFEVTSTSGYPMNDWALDRALRQQLTINCVVSARKPA